MVRRQQRSRSVWGETRAPSPACSSSVFLVRSRGARPYWAAVPSTSWRRSWRQWCRRPMADMR
eukprot:10849950-Lingulodinium_polyedra.AAC.1